MRCSRIGGCVRENEGGGEWRRRREGGCGAGRARRRECRVGVSYERQQHVRKSTEWLNVKAREERVRALTEQLKTDLLRTVAMFDRPIFTTALIAGDVVLLDVLHKSGLVDHVPVVFMDTLHLFNETLEFLEDCEERYGFKAERYLPAGCADRKDWNEQFSSDLYMTDVEKYDQHAKVEPLSRALTELRADAWINGRRRDHGFDRAFLDVYESPSGGVDQFKVNAIAHWTFRDCWDYLELNEVPYHPLHDEGYPSIGDLQSTLPVPKEKWFEYAGERSGRWSGEGKTECGIHTFEKKREE
ncbi:phosphoadenosine-phosphosulfate reductase [Chloropicon primus]|uniref:Phosphoadenosine-phosphosulfate reductase n=1 Tax=Chloropicon primus TaxID=1764295 RepID=A0A5B8ME90_9CHLO|nr:phosphoadenosine-phosphosulfate reductase [Chloropicon primus]UPQ97780.1 phosphoadenosine-phosphosulfate reductase [Chloropicon primus]|eukprot:QDZ18571.1 phosphoadenosine-phosphosulfate reductase [Chloropicon primus]